MMLYYLGVPVSGSTEEVRMEETYDQQDIKTLREVGQLIRDLNDRCPFVDNNIVIISILYP